MDETKGNKEVAVISAAEAKASIAKIEPLQAIRMSSGGVPIYPEMTVRKATREGYKISVYVYKAIRTIVQAASGIPWIVNDSEGTPIEGHPFTKAWNKPNGEFSGQDNMEFLLSHLLLCGNALIQPLMVGGKPKEFWIAMPDLVVPVPSEKPGEWLKEWRVYVLGGGMIGLPPENFIHFQQIDPGNPYWGIGPLMAAARTVDTDNEAQDTQKISMQNRGMTDGVFTHEAIMTPEQFEEARRQVRENYLAKQRRREPWVLGAGAKWNPMSMTPIEMDFIASRLSNLRAIAAAFGLDPWWLGDRSSSTYNNVMEARKALYEDVVLPILEDIKSTLNLKVAPMYGEGIEITYNVSKIAALREDFGKKVDQAKSLWSMGIPFNQINDKLTMGFDEFEGWNKGYLPMSLVPTGTSQEDLTNENPADEAPSVDEEDEDGEEDQFDENGDPIKVAKGGPGSDNFGCVGRSGDKSADMTEEYKDRYWKRIDTRRNAYHGILQKRFKPLYVAIGDDIAKRAENGSVAKKKESISKAILSHTKDWEKTMTAVYMVIIEDFGKDTSEQMSLDIGMQVKAFNPFSSYVRAWIAKNAAKSVKTVLETQIGSLHNIIVAGVDGGLTNSQIAAEIRAFYDANADFMSMRVARTETTKAAGYAQREAALEGGANEKEWISSRDDRVRGSDKGDTANHIEMDGEVQDINEPYSNGLMFPGDDSTNDLDEFMECRCVEKHRRV